MGQGAGGQSAPAPTMPGQAAPVTNARHRGDALDGHHRFFFCLSFCAPFPRFPFGARTAGPFDLLGMHFSSLRLSHLGRTKRMSSFARSA